MNKPKFQVGDRVRIVSTVPDSWPYTPKMQKMGGKYGVIKEVGKSWEAFLVKIDNEPGIPQWWLAEHLREGFQPNETLIVMTDGKETRAITKKNSTIIHDVTLHRHPDDEPNLLNAAKYAVERIKRISKKKEKPPVRKLLNTKVVCVDNAGLEGVFTEGRVYDIMDGVLCTDSGRSECSVYRGFCSIDDLNDRSRERWTAARFIEYKGGA